MAQSTASLLAEIDAQVPDNSSGVVTPLRVRTVLKDMVGPRFAFTPSTAPTARGDTSSLATAFSGDLTQVQNATSYVLTGAASLSQPTSGYVFTPERSQNFSWYENHSGWNQLTDNQGGRTAAVADFSVVNNFGQGDTVGYHVAAVVAGAKPGATHFLANPAVTGFSCAGFPGNDGVFINPFISTIEDFGSDIAAIGFESDMQRTNATGALHAYWTGYQVDSFGSQPIDHAYRAIGALKTGLHMSDATFANNAAIVTGPNARWYGNAIGGGSLDPIGALNDAYIGYDSTLGAWLMVAGNLPTVQVYNSGLAVISGNLWVTGNTILTPPTSVTPASNGQLVVQKTSNTSLTFKLKGSDGTVRSASLTLA